MKSDTSLRTGNFPSYITILEMRLHIDFKTPNIEKSEQEAVPTQEEKGNHNHSSNLVKRNEVRAHLCCPLDSWNHLNSSSSVTPVRDILKSDYLKQKDSVYIWTAPSAGSHGKRVWKKEALLAACSASLPLVSLPSLWLRHSPLH